MRYTVVYDRAARNESARIWNSAADQQAVANASDAIDRLLKRQPDQVGRTRGSYRELTVHPLRVVFSISPDDRMVRVVKVRRLLSSADGNARPDS
jgi:hypothetical protein